jgi:ERF superfamily
MDPEISPEIASPPGGPLESPPLLAPLDPQALLAKAIEHNVSVDTMERLLTLRERLKAEQARAAFFMALAAFQGACPVISKTKTITIRPQSGGSYSYKYAPLDIIVEQVRGLLQAHGLSYTIKTRQDEGSLTAICEVHHEAGHTEASELTVPIDRAARMNDTQKVGAARTYAMRYAWCNAFGILTGDEDTDAATVEPDAPAVTFEAPRRVSPIPTAAPEEPLERTLKRSVDAVAAARRTQEADEDVPRDALSKPRLGRLFALLHAAVADADVPESDHEVMFNRAREYLRAWVETTTGREYLAYCPFTKYQDLCDQIPAAVEAALSGVARPQPRLVRRRTYSAPRRPPLH